MAKLRSGSLKAEPETGILVQGCPGKVPSGAGEWGKQDGGREKAMGEHGLGEISFSLSP